MIKQSLLNLSHFFPMYFIFVPNYKSKCIPVINLNILRQKVNCGHVDNTKINVSKRCIVVGHFIAL